MTDKPRTEKQERAAEALRAIAANFEAMRPEVLLARAEAAEKERDGAQRGYEYAIKLREAAEARCATLEAVLQAARDVIDNDGDDARWDRFCKAVESATPPAECDGSGECKAQTHTHGCYSDRGNCDQPTEHVMGRRVRAALEATPPAEEEVVAAASVLGLSREETDELVRLARSEGIRTQPVEKEGTP